MSNTQSNAAIQDVLSSIRRLVSQDLRTEPRQDQHASAPGPGNFDGKLVLTDALRVPDTPSSEEMQFRQRQIDEMAAESGTGPSPDDAEERPQPHRSLADAWNEVAALDQDRDDVPSVTGSTGASLEDTIAELEAAVAGIDETFEPDGSEDRPGVAFAQDDDDTVLEFSFPVDEADDGSDHESEETVATPQDNRRNETDEVTADGGSEKPETKGVSIRLGFDDPAAAGHAVAADDATGSAVAQADGGDARHKTAMLAGAGLPSAGRIRRLNLAGSGDDAQPAMIEREKVDQPDLADAAHPEADHHDAAHPHDDDDDDHIFADAADDGVIDREALRELVAEIIRQELQGPLGERITRNVRKLVRREINRALDIDASES